MLSNCFFASLVNSPLAAARSSQVKPNKPLTSSGTTSPNGQVCGGNRHPVQGEGDLQVHSTITAAKKSQPQKKKHKEREDTF